jgi:sortase A
MSDLNGTDGLRAPPRPYAAAVLLARVLGGVGRLLIWTGAIVLLFVAYQLWGTNVAEARAQDDLEDQFEASLGDGTSDPSSSTTEPDDEPATTTTAAPPPPPDDGEAIARVVIPEIGVDKIVVEGVSRSDLRKGPGHYPDTALPGQPGNAAIAGHRTTYGAPFHRIDELEVGDEILVTTLQGSFTYEVTAQQIVRPTDVEVIEDQGDDRLTLTSCHPKYSARERIVVSAELVDDPAPRSGERETDPGPEVEPEEPEELRVLDGEERGPIEPAIAWGGITFAVWLAFAVLSRRWRRWPSYLLGAPVFAVVLFVFFEAVAETLPANF